MNFVPIKDILPKNDIEYLLAYTLYVLAKQKPVFWVVDNTNYLNSRTLNYFKVLKKVFQYLPIAVVFVVEDDRKVINQIKPQNENSVIIPFETINSERIINFITKYLDCRRVPADIEKIVKHADSNLLYAFQLIEFLKDHGFIFKMKNSWRFSKVDDDFKFPETLSKLVLYRFSRLDKESYNLLKRLVLLNIYDIPKSLFSSIFKTGDITDIIDNLINKGFLVDSGSYISFTTATILNILRKNIKVSDSEKMFYRDLVYSVSSSKDNFYPLNKNWLLLSYINLGGLVDKRLNSFLFSSAAYLERLGFFEIAQRSYQTILSSFGAEDSYDDFKILLEIKNSSLWRFIEPQWATMFWKKLQDTARKKDLYHISLVATGESILLDRKKVNLDSLDDVIAKLNDSGCYQNELSFIDRVVGILIDTSDYEKAYEYISKADKIISQIYNEKKSDVEIEKGDVVGLLYIKIRTQLAEISYHRKLFSDCSEILENLLPVAKQLDATYFVSKIFFIFGNMEFVLNREWESYAREGFEIALSKMLFPMIKNYFFFFEKNNLENKSWVEPYLEYKNWLNL